MLAEENTRPRVSIAERLVPALACGMAAMGVVGLLPPALVAGCIGMMIAALKSPSQTGIAQVGETAATLLLISIFTGFAAQPVLLALSVIPFRGPALETGGSLGLSADQNATLAARVIPKRPATIIVIILIEVAIAALAVWSFAEMLASRREMMLH